MQRRVVCLRAIFSAVCGRVTKCDLMNSVKKILAIRTPLELSYLCRNPRQKSLKALVFSSLFCVTVHNRPINHPIQHIALDERPTDALKICRIN